MSQLLAISSLMALALTTAQVRDRARPPELALQKVVVECPNADTTRAILHGPAAPQLAGAALSGQRLHIGGIVIPLGGAPSFASDANGSRATITVELRTVPEDVLALDPTRMPVRWEGLDGNGQPLVALVGEVSWSDRGSVVLPVDRLQELYSQLVSYTVKPHGLTVAVRALVSLYNPFSFEVVATSAKYTLTVGTQVLLDNTRPGIRLRPQKHNDLLLEEEVGIGEIASGVAAYFRQEPAQLDGFIVIRTPRGERGIPLQLRAGP